LREGQRAVWYASADLANVAASPDANYPVGPLPSRFALSPLAAVRQMAGGGARTSAVRARAVNAPVAFGPAEAAFDAGWLLFVQRRLQCVRSRTPWGALLKVSKALWLSGAEAPGDEDEEDSVDSEMWDPERVCRHLDRSVMQGGQLLRRARWLCLLADSCVAWLDMGAEGRRLLVLEGGEVAGRGDLSADEPIPLPRCVGRRFRDRQRIIDAVRYDRLRVLTTELKRVALETGSLAVRVNARTVLEGEALRRILRWV
jgi:hypothetical protein